MLAGVLVRNKEEGGDLKLAALNEIVTRVFRIIWFDQFFSIHDTREATVADFAPVSLFSFATPPLSP